MSRAELQIIGDGPEHERLQELARTCGIEGRVGWLGQMETDQAVERMAQADLLVLPSRKDGWGAVVNEALMVGTPVICSSACGASDLLRHPWIGSVFQSGNVSGLVAELNSWIRKGKVDSVCRDRLRQWSRCIHAPAIAGYVEQIMEHIYNGKPRPEAPWRVDEP